MAGVKAGGARAAKHKDWYLKGTDTKVIRVICPKGMRRTAKSYWATREGSSYTRVEKKDMELR